MTNQKHIALRGRSRIVGRHDIFGITLYSDSVKRAIHYAKNRTDNTDLPRYQEKTDRERQMSGWVL